MELKILFVIALVVIILLVMWYINKPKPPKKKKDMTYGEFARINGDIIIP